MQTYMQTRPHTSTNKKKVHTHTHIYIYTHYEYSLQNVNIDKCVYLYNLVHPTLVFKRAKMGRLVINIITWSKCKSHSAPASSTSRYSCASWGLQICIANSMNPGQVHGNGLCLHQEDMQTLTSYQPKASMFETSIFSGRSSILQQIWSNHHLSIKECNTNCRLYKALI